LAAVALAGHHDGSNAHDKAKNASAGDPDGVSETTAPVIGSTDKPPETISPEVGKGMLAEFQRAQGAELKALDHRNKLELKELKTSQAARQKEWEKHEQGARHRFFAEHTRGPDRRAYIKDFLERHRAFQQQIKDEMAQRLKDQEARIAALREDQSARLKEFRESLGRNERPAARLWPGSA
jgi:hypothetical protein